GGREEMRRDNQPGCRRRACDLRVPAECLGGETRFIRARSVPDVLLAVVLCVWSPARAQRAAPAAWSGRGAGAAASQASPQRVRGNQPQAVLWIVPHTHWEGAVFKTREEYLDVGLPN